jgi:predicted HAD superfamily phosphohydrolase
VKDNGGLSIAVNADEFAVRNAMVAIATEDMQEIKPIIDAWVRGGFDSVRMFAAERQFTHGKERGFQSEERKARISIVTPQSVESTTAIHREYRVKIRGDAIPLL